MNLGLSKKIIDSVYHIFEIAIYGYVLLNWTSFNLTGIMILDFILIVFIVSLLQGFINLLSIIIHELGHFIFGKIAQLDFISFHIFNIVFIKENNKLQIKKQPVMPGMVGCCSMSFNEKKKYNKNKIMFYYMGGIIFNFILVLIFLILLLLTNNLYWNTVSFLFINLNLYRVFCNAIPFKNNVGVSSDMTHWLNYKKDSEYGVVLGKITRIQTLLSQGKQLKEMEETLFYMPKTFSFPSQILLGRIYIDYLVDKDMYKQAIEKVKYMLENGDKTLSLADISSLKSQLLFYLFKENDFDLIPIYYDSDTKKYLEEMGRVVPQFFAIGYMCSLVIKNEEEADNYLNEFMKIKKNYQDKNQIKEAEDIIKQANKKYN